MLVNVYPGHVVLFWGSQAVSTPGMTFHLSSHIGQGVRMKNTYKYATDNPLTQKDTTKNMFMEFLGL